MMSFEGKEAPALRELVDWINTKELSFEHYRGTVRFIEFWDHTDVSSMRSCEFTQRLWERYGQTNFVAIGIHTPEYIFEWEPSNVAAAVERFGITYPAALDNNKTNWVHYGNRYIPKQFVIAQDDTVASEHVGEGNEYKIEATIRTLLEREGAELPRPLWSEGSSIVSGITDVSRPLYLGFRQVMGLRKAPTLVPAATRIARDDGGPYDDDIAYLDGEWRQYDEYVEHEGDGEGSLTYRFFASSVFAVITTIREGDRIGIELDEGELPPGTAVPGPLCPGCDGKELDVTYSGLYHLLSLPEPGHHTLTLRVAGPGVRIYVLSFE
ncbi:MAG TPA: hypothetical protein ENN11_02450 [Methanomicrobia archaeon]|nr:hypothetical protein [Methanomicrobia archaeon]